MTKITGDGAEAALTLYPEGVLVVHWRGIVTMRSGEATKRAIADWLPERPKGIVSDYRRAAVVMTAAELVRIMVGAEHDMPELPAVVIANDCMWDSMYRASITAAASGRWRYVSRDPSEAMAVALRLRGLGRLALARSSAR